MRILYLTNKPIFPIVDGGCKAMHQFLKCLIQNEYSIEHICLSTFKHTFDPDNYPKSITKDIPTSAFEIDTRIKLFPALKSLFTRKSYVLSRFDNAEFHSKLKEVLTNGDFTHIILESLFLSPYIETIRNSSKAKIILRTHNVEHEIWRQLAINTANPLKKFYLNRLSLDLKKNEIENLNKVDLIATITNEDSKSFDDLDVNTPKITIPIAIDLTEVNVDYSKTNLFFIGSMNWKPNIEAVNWIVNEILPKIKSIHPSVEFHLAGSFMGNQFPSNPIKGIVNHDFVNDSHQFMQNNGILTTPIRSGSGVRVKLLEAMSLGVPVVTTSAGALGINQNNSLLFAETSDDFVPHISELIYSQEKRMILGGKARKFIEENNSISSISNSLNDSIKHL